jgi:pilus assembly protein Flp/PilA
VILIPVGFFAGMGEAQRIPAERVNMRLVYLRARRLLLALHEEESAQDLIEYALLAALVAVGAVVGLNTVTNSVNSAFTGVQSKLHSHIGKHLGWGK